VLRHNTSFSKRLVKLLDISGIIGAVIVEFFQGAHVVVQVVVVFAPVARLLRRELEWKVARSTSNKLRLGNGSLAGLACLGISRVVETHDIEEIEHIPTLVELVHCKYHTDFVVVVFQGIDKQLFRFALRFRVHHQAPGRRKFDLYLSRQVCPGDAPPRKVSKRFPDNGDRGGDRSRACGDNRL